MDTITAGGDCSHPHTHKVFLLSNYVLLGAASSCIFLTLSLRLFPSLVGFLFILLQILTIAGAVSGCAAASRAASSAGKFYGAHMEDDGVLILKLAGGLCVLMFCLEWVVLTLAFFLNYYAYVERRGINGNNNGYGARSGKVQDEEDLKSWPWPFQV
ncbi:hypothetical protein PHJA_001721900 [Phtheirospermum japonicum]|uniref:Uncharacterized protein n=1 Tax=Phtheirospermum japonicum TaxID=374723 RepID=A0A830C4X3_9LAMI|nr:hypothetical protein PHJA_001721900 [Phtheirospermum japonicum]